jgi:hypothetical protein
MRCGTVKEESILERRSSAWLMFLRRRLSMAAISLSCSRSTWQATDTTHGIVDSSTHPPKL